MDHIFYLTSSLTISHKPIYRAFIRKLTRTPINLNVSLYRTNAELNRLDLVHDHSRDCRFRDDHIVNSPDADKTPDLTTTSVLGNGQT